MITGTIVYDASDLKRLETAFGQAAPMPLWRGALIMCGLGAVIGLGATTLIERLLGSADALLGGAAPWGALVGVVLAVSAGAWRLGKSAANPIVDKPQAVEIGVEGIRLSTPKADSMMRWPLFTAKTIQPGFVALRTEDNTWVLLRPEFFATAADFASAVQLVDARVN